MTLATSPASCAWNPDSVSKSPITSGLPRRNRRSARRARGFPGHRGPPGRPDPSLRYALRRPHQVRSLRMDRGKGDRTRRRTHPARGRRAQRKGPVRSLRTSAGTLDADRAGSSQQSRRVRMPEIAPAPCASSAAWPRAPRTVTSSTNPSPRPCSASSRQAARSRTPFALLIGPEGGWTDAERQTRRCRRHGFRFRLGPQILRAETAACAALAIVCQCLAAVTELPTNSGKLNMQLGRGLNLLWILSLIVIFSSCNGASPGSLLRRHDLGRWRSLRRSCCSMRLCWP